MLSGFEETCRDEQVAALPASWGGKSGLSILDEEALFGSPAAQQTQPGLEVGVFRADLVASLVLTMALGEPYTLIPPASERPWVEFELSTISWPGFPAEVSHHRAFQVMKQSCCLHALERDIKDKCPVCLENLAHGQLAWILPCVHFIHYGCGLRFFGQRKVKLACPMCRYDIEHAPHP